MKKIGFVDYYLSEWHANQYPAWIQEVSEKMGEDFALAYAWAELEVSPEDGITTDSWCEKFGAQKCETLAALCERSDYIIVLAPSYPEKHLRYAKEVLQYGKRTYIDKTFAPDYATAKEIFATAERYHTPVFSSSALRYATELQDVQADAVIVTGGGGNFDEYIIHQIEMAVRLLGVQDTKVKVEKSGKGYVSTVAFADGKEATLLYAQRLPFTVHVDNTDGTTVYLPIRSEFFKGLLADILHFFKTGERSFDSAETLRVMAIREALIRAKNELGNWIHTTEQ